MSDPYSWAPDLEYTKSNFSNFHAITMNRIIFTDVVSNTKQHTSFTRLINDAQASWRLSYKQAPGRFTE